MSGYCERCGETICGCADAQRSEESDSTAGLGKHLWKCLPGIWESDYFCQHCKAHHQQRHDVPGDTEPPEYGCVPNAELSGASQLAGAASRSNAELDEEG